MRATQTKNGDKTMKAESIIGNYKFTTDKNGKAIAMRWSRHTGWVRHNYDKAMQACQELTGADRIK